MTSPRLFRCLAPFLVAAALSSGCSRLLPSRHGSARSFDMVLDTRRAASPALAGCFIPETFPAISKLPVVLAGKIPARAKFTGVTVEVLLKNETGDPLALLRPVIENNQVYLEFAASKPDAFTQVVVAVTAKYDYR
jgi:hypothetical protein